MSKITVFTPTYNRGYIIDKLYQSLQQQTCKEFEWLVIDDGSDDDTEELFRKYKQECQEFTIVYQKIKNGGKQRAINMAVKMIRTKYMFIVDSDDFLLNNAIEKILNWVEDIDEKQWIAGVAGVKGDKAENPIGGKVKFDSSYIECSNLERSKYGLAADMAEVYKVDLLKKYPFSVWAGEKFVPEAVVWDAIALDGYKLRWYQDVIYICEYLEDGLTKGSWNLLKKNPMGYAMLFNIQLRYIKKLGERCRTTLQMISCAVLAKEKSFLKKSNAPILSKILFPAGVLLALRRKKQFQTM